MPKSWSVVRSRAGLIFGGATVTVLVLPVNAFAIAIHMPRQHAGAAVSALDLVLVLGGLAAVLLLTLAVSRLRTSKPLSARPTRRAAVE
jgi:hypothetical protein